MKIVFSHSTESVGRGNFLCFRKFRVSKNIMPMKRISRFSIENLLSQSTESFRRGTFLCFRKFRVSKRLMDKRGGCREGVSHLSAKSFLSHSSKKIS